MKVAVCISGQPRNVHKGFTYIQPNLLQYNDCDIFIHTWFDVEQVGEVYVNAGGHVASDPLQENVVHEILRLYNPLAILAEEQIDFDERDYAERAYPAISPFASLSQKYSAMKAHGLRRSWEEKNNVVYDAVVRLRFDYALRTPIDAQNFDLSVVNVPNRCPHAGGIDDTFAIGNPDIMNVYGDLYDSIPQLYDSDVPFCDELLLGQHLVRNNISVRLHDIQYDLIRG